MFLLLRHDKSVIYLKLVNNSFKLSFHFRTVFPDSDAEEEILSYLFNAVTLMDPQTLYKTLFLNKKRINYLFNYEKPGISTYKYSHLELDEF